MVSKMGIGTLIKDALHPASTSERHTKPVLGDMVLVTAIIALGIFGLLMLYSASTDFSYLVYGKANFMFNKQVLWMVVGTVIALVLARLDYHAWRKLALPVMVVTIALLVAVLINNQSRYGAVRSIFGGSVQPSELAKVATVIYLSVWLYTKREHLHDVQLGLVPLAAILGIIGGLIYIQPDLSATATIFILGGLLFFLADGDLRQIVLFMVVALIAGWIVVQFSDTGRQRLADYLAGLKDPLQSAYQVKRSFEAIIKGGFFGVGLGNSSAKLTNLPVPPTDSIFAVVAEELGLVGTLGLIGLFGVLLWRGIKIARRAPDSLGMVMAAGLTFWIVIEAFINMGVMVGLFPFAGNALPFVSAGGSNLVSSLAAIGILVNISRQSGKPAPQPEKTEERRSYSATVDLRRRDRRRRFTRSSRPASREHQG
jgi:cell division protein FtsW